MTLRSSQGLGLGVRPRDHAVSPTCEAEDHEGGGGEEEEAPPGPVHEDPPSHGAHHLQWHCHCHYKCSTSASNNDLSSAQHHSLEVCSQAVPMNLGKPIGNLPIMMMTRTLEKSSSV